MVLENEVPERTYVQRITALDEGNRIRTVRAEFKKNVKRGKASVVDVLLAEPSPKDFASMPVVTLMTALPKVGKVKTKKILDKAKVSPSKTVGGMTARQRRELASWLAPYDNGAGGS